MSDRAPINHYFIDVMAPFPKRWRDKIGLIEVMCEPVKGWVMCRRPHAVPFCLRVSHLTNAERHPIHGPFEHVEKRKSRAISVVQRDGKTEV